MAKLLPVLGRPFHFGWHLRSTFFRSSASVLVLLVGHGTQDGIDIAFSTTSVACFLSAIFNLHTAGVAIAPFHYGGHSGPISH